MKLLKVTPLILSLLLGVVIQVDAQTRRRTPQRSTRTTKPPPKPPIIGANVVLVTKNGDRISGELMDLTAYSVRIKAGTLESILPLESLASLSFGTEAEEAGREDRGGAPTPGFDRDADAVLRALRSMARNLDAGVDYTEYGRLLSELRRPAERFVSRYALSENEAESRIAALVAGALNDYTWARTIWNFRFGRSGDGTVTEGDSPVIADALSLYSDLRGEAAVGNKYSSDKLVTGLWRHAAKKIDTAQGLLTVAGS